MRNILVALWRSLWRGHLFPALSFKRNITALAGLLALVLGYGAMRLNEGPPPDRSSLRIASIQPNMGPRISPRAMVRDSKLFRHDKAQIIPAVCFDAQSPDLLRSGLERGGQVLVVQSNDRIFKQSKIGLFDLAINIASAVAMRVPMVKVNNSGYGASLQANGRLVPDSITPVYRRLATVHEVILQPRFSLYRRFGNWFIYLAGVMTVVGLVGSARSSPAFSSAAGTRAPPGPATSHRQRRGRHRPSTPRGERCGSCTGSSGQTACGTEPTRGALTLHSSRRS